MIKRIAENDIKKWLNKKKTIIIIGARQTGKTTLLEELFKNNTKALWFNGDEERTHNIFDNLSKKSFEFYIKKGGTIIIDEAQRIKNIGLKLKIIHDAFKDKVQIIATGSSSFDLSNKINEPLTGRKIELKMFPLSFEELVNETNLLEEQNMLEQRLVFGSYPEIVVTKKNREQLLTNLVNDNLYKDIFKLSEVRNIESFEKILKALAYQIGSTVNILELSNMLNISRQTITKHIHLLEQVFIIFRIGSFNRNLRNELRNSNKYYFYDNGIRNALIGNLNGIKERHDIGQLFENYIFSEMAKKYLNKSVGAFAYFWRTKQKQEIDFIRTKAEKIFAYEIKYSEKQNAKFSKQFIDKYNPTEIRTINRLNYHEILLSKN